MNELNPKRIGFIFTILLWSAISFAQDFPCSPAGVMPPVPCPCSVNAGPNKRFCYPGGTVQLNGTKSGNPYPVTWEDSPWLSDPDILNPYVNAPFTQTYYLVGQCLHPTNLVINGDFAISPKQDFSTDYKFDTFPGNFQPGHITITGTPSAFDPSFPDCLDHTPTSDNKMLLIDGSDHPGEDIWCQSIYLDADTCYQLDIWIATLTNVNICNLTWSIDGALFGNLEPWMVPCTWNLASFVFEASGGVSKFCLQDIVGDTDGNDFVIDDISVRKICKMRDAVTVFVDSVKMEEKSVTMCEGDTYIFGSNSLTEPGIYEDLFKTWHGCDSMVTIDLKTVVTEAYINPDVWELNCNNKTVILNGYGSSKGGGYSYLWTTTNGHIIGDPKKDYIEVDKPGKYVLHVKYFKDGLSCEKTEEVEVKENYKKPIISAGFDAKFTCNDSILILNGTVTSPFSDYSVEWTTDIGVFNSKTDDLAPVISAAGTYTLLVTDETNGCTATDVVVITKDPSVPKAKLTGPTILNCNIDSVLLDANGSDVGPKYTFKWTTTGGSFMSSTDLLKVYVNKAGSYQFNVVDISNGCKVVANINVTEDKTPPIVDAGSNDTLSCLQVDTDLSGSSNITDLNSEIEWFTKDGVILSGENSYTPKVGATGIYYLSIKNKENGCEAIDSVYVIKDASFPIADAGINDTLTCINNLAELNASNSSQGPNIEYLWTVITGNITGPFNTAETTADQSGAYLLTVTNKLNGCVETDTVNVLLNIDVPVSNIQVPELLTCKDLEVILNATGSSTGTNINYNWQTNNGNISGSTNLINTNVDLPGWYYLSVSDKINGCSSTDSILVKQDIVKPDLSIEGPVVLNCKKSIDVLNTINNNPGLNLSYKWNTNNGIIVSGGNTATPTIDGSGNYTLITTNTSNGCTDEDMILVTFDGVLPIAKAGNDTILNCCSPAIQLNGSYSHNNPNVSFIWATKSGNIISGQTTLSPNINSNGTYYITVTDASTGCIGIDSLKVTEDKVIPVSSLTNPGKLTCINNNLSIGLNNTDPSWSYQWTTTNGNITGGTSGTSIKINETGYYKVNIYNNINCCTYKDSIPISEDKETPIIDAGPSKTLTCKDTIFTLEGKINNATGNEPKQWYTFQGNIISGAQTLNPVINTEAYYYFSVTNNSNGCKAIDSVLILRNKNYPTDVILDVNDPGCNLTGSVEVESVTGGVGPYQYSLNGSGFQNQTIFEDLEPGNYYMEVIDFNGCKTNGQFFVPEPQDIAVTLPPDITVIWEDSTHLVPKLFGLDEEDIATVKWIPGKWLNCDTCFSPIINKANNTELYTVYITDKFGCTAQAQIRVFIDKNLDLYIPNAFSPNDDQINDKWWIFADPNKVTKLHTIQVFDRWGELLWETKDLVPSLFPDVGWDGIFRGVPLNPGVFVYWTLVEFADGKKKVYKGDITLMK